MSQPPIEALPDDIARLLAREKDAYPVDPKALGAVLSRVEMAIALGGGGGPSSPPGSAGAGPVAASVGSAAPRSVAGKMIAVALAAFVGGGVTGGVVVKTMTHVAVVPPVVAILPPASSAAPAPVAEPVAPAPSSPNAEAPSPTPRASAAPSTSSVPGTRGDLIREREVLDVARAALAHGQPRDAISAMQEHARRWPNGALSEEREVVLIQALVAAGRGPEARARAAHFHQTFPKSIFAPAVHAALAAAPASP